MSSSLPTSVPISQLGLTSSEQQILRQHQQLAAQGHGSGGSTRGRGTARNSQPSSRAASAASSQQGRLMIDPGSLRLLQQHFDAVLASIRRRIEALEQHSDAAVQAIQALSQRSEAAADREIQRYRQINAEMDRLDSDMDTIIRLNKVVSSVAERVRDASQRLDRAGGSSHGQRRR